MKHIIKVDGIEVALTGTTASVLARQAIEVRIAAAFIDAALWAGYKISVDNGGDEEGKQSSSKQVILEEMFQTDEDILFIYKPEAGTKQSASWAKFIYGNDGWDVISDYTVDLEPLMQGEVERLQDEFSS